MSEKPLDTLVLGAGLGGLAHAWWAQTRGASVEVWEARREVGGVIRSELDAGYGLEWGASSLPSTARHVAALLASVEASGAEVPELLAARDAANRQFLYRGGRLRPVPRTPRALLRSSLLPLSGRLRLFAEPIMPRRRAAGPAAERLDAFVTRRFGRHVTETFLRPFVNGIYGCAPEHLGAGDAFPVLPALEARHGSVLRGLARRGRSTARRVQLIAGGMAALPRAVAGAMGSRVQVGRSAARVIPGTGDRPAAVIDSEGHRREAHEVVLALPARAQGALLRAHDPAAFDHLDGVDAVPMAVVSIGWRPGCGPSVPEGFGFLVDRGARLRILGATFRHALHASLAPAGHALLTVYVGGSEDRGIVDLSTSALHDLVLRDLERVLGGRIEPDLVRSHVWPRAIPVFAPGHRGRVAALTARLTEGRLRLAGSHVTGVSLDHCVAPGTPLADPSGHGAVRL